MGHRAGRPPRQALSQLGAQGQRVRAFVRAAGTRYSGRFRPKGSSSPLPRVSIWSVWNEPNLGFELAPQGVPGNLRVPNSGQLYRGLVSAAWTGLHQTGHGKDTILIGELGPRGAARWGVFAAMKPLMFMQALYCVDSELPELRGYAAKEEGCPTTAGRLAEVPGAEPGAVRSAGIGVHLWARWYPPNSTPSTIPITPGCPTCRTSSRRSTGYCASTARIRVFPHLQHRVRIYHQPAQSHGSVRLAGDRLLLPELGGIHVLARPSHP